MTEADAKRVIEGSAGNAGGVLEQLADLICEKSCGVAPEKVAKSQRRHNYGTVIAAVLSALVVASGSYYATEARSKSNETAIVEQKQAVKANAINIESVDSKVDGLGVKIDVAMVQQTAILSSVTELKAEQVGELKEKLADAKREVSELRRRRGR